MPVLAGFAPPITATVSSADSPTRTVSGIAEPMPLGADAGGCTAASALMKP
jgi:hypothetical protein